MSDIAASYIPSTGAGYAARSKSDNVPAGFDALLTDSTTKLDAKEMAARLTENIALSMNKNLKALAQSTTPNIFPFSEEFEATFGTSGPLFDFINMITAKLGLTKEQNQALQDISIRNKDITYTPENVQKIAAELKEAGIG